MTVPYLPIGTDSKIAPFKNPQVKPYGPLSNTTTAWNYPIKQSITIHKEQLNFFWPSAEHAYHAQKIFQLKAKLPENDPLQLILTQTLRQIETSKSKPKEVFLPQKDYEPIIEHLLEKHPELAPSFKLFEARCDAHYSKTHGSDQGLMANGKPYLLKFIHNVLKLKLDQHPELKELAIHCAREGIIPIQVDHHDCLCSSGENGDGVNLIGLATLELGNHYLKNSGEKPAICDPWGAYDSLVKLNKNALRYSNLIQFTEANQQGWIFPKQSSIKPIKKEQTTQFIQRKLAKHGCIMATITSDIKKPGQMALLLRFSTPEEATSFKSNYCGGPSTRAFDDNSDGKTITLGATRIALVLRKLGIDHCGHTKPTPVIEALRKEHLNENFCVQSMRYFKAAPQQEKTDSPEKKPQKPIG